MPHYGAFDRERARFRCYLLPRKMRNFMGVSAYPPASSLVAALRRCGGELTYGGAGPRGIRFAAGPEIVDNDFCPVGGEQKRIVSPYPASCSRPLVCPL